MANEKLRMSGEEVRALRLRLGKSQYAFGAALGFGHPQIRMSEVEHGKRNLSPKKVEMCLAMKKGRVRLPKKSPPVQ